MTLIFVSQNYDLWPCLHVHLKSTVVSIARLNLFTQAAADNKPRAGNRGGLAVVPYNHNPPTPTPPPTPAFSFSEISCRCLWTWWIQSYSLGIIWPSEDTEIPAGLIVKGQRVTNQTTWWELKYRGPEETCWQTGWFPPSLTSKMFLKMSISTDDRPETIRREWARWETQIVWMECSPSKRFLPEWNN